MPCATHTSYMGWRAYKTFPTSSLPVARHCYLFEGLYGQVGWSLGITMCLATTRRSVFDPVRGRIFTGTGQPKRLHCLRSSAG